MHHRTGVGARPVRSQVKRDFLAGLRARARQAPSRRTSAKPSSERSPNELFVGLMITLSPMRTLRLPAVPNV